MGEPKEKEEKKPITPKMEGKEKKLLDNSTHWLQQDLSTGQIDLKPHSVHEYIDQNGTRYTLNEETGEYEVTIPGPNDD
ncbi:MAG: hypothetical protein UR61_C0026G0002 [candidate division WS6 bacterium GW2011_GWE1_34_7]|uniref:Uncharacterized protein n=1 Tax=candidate division WS6 bacterium GW2011_GWE1_34_7 TaxID=1619093 RepID=A0A0G0B7K0_9BACT|nr:MAG: hypothetical protein UR61_C0026G0002 [candidate division WS6 bacterium GW2011_GWE1_34_7]